MKEKDKGEKTDSLAWLVFLDIYHLRNVLFSLYPGSSRHISLSMIESGSRGSQIFNILQALFFHPVGCWRYFNCAMLLTAD